MRDEIKKKSLHLALEASERLKFNAHFTHNEASSRLNC